MTIEYYIEKCPHVTEVTEGTRFRSPSEVGVIWASRFLSTRTTWLDFRTLGRPFAKRNDRKKVFVSDTISFIEHGSSATHRIVIYSDATSGNAAGAWKTVSSAAQSYAYAEQSAVESPHGGPLQHWPNSVYQLFGNNSNTFIREMARAIGRDADGFPGGSLPGNEYPQGVPYPRIYSCSRALRLMKKTVPILFLLLLQGCLMWSWQRDLGTCRELSPGVYGCVVRVPRSEQLVSVGANIVYMGENHVPIKSLRVRITNEESHEIQVQGISPFVFLKPGESCEFTVEVYQYSKGVDVADICVFHTNHGAIRVRFEISGENLDDTKIEINGIGGIGRITRPW